MVPEIEPYNNYKGDGKAVQFDFDFYIEDETQLVVYHTDSDGVQSTLTYGTDYSINEFKNENGSYIIFPLSGSSYDVLGSDEVISLCLTLPISQESEYGTSGELDLSSLEYSFDYLTRICQIINRKTERAAIVPEGSEASPEEMLASISEAVGTTRTYAANAASSANSAQNSAATAEEQAAIAAQQAAEVEETYNEAMSSITSAQSTAVETIQSIQADAESAILNDKETALNSISSAETSAVEACEEEVQKAKEYAAAAENALSATNCLPLSGGTMTGTIKTDGVTPILSSNTTDNNYVTTHAVYNTNDDRAATPDVQHAYYAIRGYDGNNNAVGETLLKHTTSGWNVNVLRSYDADENSAEVSIYAPAGSGGSAYATAPTYSADYTDSSTKICTTAFLKKVLNSSGYGLATYSKSSNGYCKFANGIIMQWGHNSMTGTTATVTLPTAFSGTSYHVVAVHHGSFAAGNSIAVTSYTTTSFVIVIETSASGGMRTDWIAIGY